MLTNQRPMGVKIPQDQNAEVTDKPNLFVQHILPLKFFAMEYAEGGKMKKAMICEFNGDYYIAPNSEEWISRLSPVSSKLRKNISESLERVSGVPVEDIPLKDDVDVVAADMASESSEEKSNGDPGGVDVFGG